MEENIIRITGKDAEKLAEIINDESIILRFRKITEGGNMIIEIYGEDS